MLLLHAGLPVQTAHIESNATLNVNEDNSAKKMFGFITTNILSTRPRPLVLEDMIPALFEKDVKKLLNTITKIVLQ